MIASAPYESTMGLVQKIFYFHVPSWFAMFTAIGVCGIASAIYLFKGQPSGRSHRRGGGRAHRALRPDRAGHRPLWGRKAWGVWWQWDAKLTIALLLEMIFISAICWCGSTAGPARTSSAAAVGALRHGERAVRLQVGQHLADDSSADVGGADAAGRRWAGRSGSASAAFMLLFVVLLMLRVNLGKRQRGARRAVSRGRGLI